MAAELAKLPAMTAATRRARGLSLRQAGAEMGVSKGTLDRFEKGEDIGGRFLVPILKWLDKKG
jgi:transcriptional regulator with XRE-family HTH domain